MDQNLLNARRAAARVAYETYDFLDARVEGQFDWEVAGEELRRTVFLAPVEAEDGVEMVTFCVSFHGAESAELDEVYCITAVGNRYGQPGGCEFAGNGHEGYMSPLTAQAQATGLYS
jgi:hypothetical protein